MNRTFAIILSVILLYSTAAFCQETADTTNITQNERILDELVVEGSACTLVKDGISIRPDKYVRNASTSGISLLYHMNIPLLKVDLIKNDVETTIGQNVSFFINGLPSSKQEVSAINPKDVSNVELLFNPTDIRFQGCSTVVNYIVRRYDFCGYAEANASQMFIFNQGKYSLYANYSRKKIYLQAYADAYYQNETTGAQSIITYNTNRISSMVNQRISNCLSKNSPWNISGVLKLRYTGTKGVLEVSAGMSDYVNRSSNTGTDIVDGSHMSEYHKTTSIKNLVPFINIYGYTTLNPTTYLIASLNTSYTAGSNNLEDVSSSMSAPLLSNVTDKSVSFNGFLALQKMACGKFLIHTSLTATHQNSYTVYENLGHLHQQVGKGTYGINAGVSFPLSGTWNIKTNVAVPFEVLSQKNHKTSCDISANASITINGSIANRHMLNLSLENSRGFTMLSMYNAIYRQTSEYEGSVGNPDIVRPYIISAKAYYTWMPTNALNLGVSAMYNHTFKELTTTYLIADNLLFSHFVNDGSLAHLKLCPSGSYSVMNGKLRMSATADIAYWKKTGLYTTSLWTCKPNVGIQFYPSGGFLCSANISYAAKNRQYAQGGGGIIETGNPWNVTVSGGASFRNMSATLMINPFYKNWPTYMYLDNPLLTKETCSHTSFGARLINVTLNYMISYGRKERLLRDLYSGATPTSSL